MYTNFNLETCLRMIKFTNDCNPTFRKIQFWKCNLMIANLRIFFLQIKNIYLISETYMYLPWSDEFAAIEGGIIEWCIITDVPLRELHLCTYTTYITTYWAVLLLCPLTEPQTVARQRFPQAGVRRSAFKIVVTDWK